jgi:hypothetical protein
MEYDLKFLTKCKTTSVFMETKALTYDDLNQWKMTTTVLCIAENLNISSNGRCLNFLLKMEYDLKFVINGKQPERLCKFYLAKNGRHPHLYVSGR